MRYFALLLLLPGPVIAQATWVSRTPSNAPAPRHEFALAYDSIHQTAILFGGGSSSCCQEYADTWSWDGTDWTMLSPANSPPARTGTSMVYDSTRQRMVLFGGWTGSRRLDDTWEWDGTNWTQAQPLLSPPARDSAFLAFDSRRGRTILFGGHVGGGSLLSDTWEYDGSTWHDISPSPHPSARWSFGLAYDEARGQTILYGGSDGMAGLGDTWAWDGQTWTPLFPPTSPGPRGGHRMAYDSDRRTIILFGGSDPASLVNDTWEWDGTTWTDIPAALPPPPRVNMGMVYDEHVRGMTVFGGRAATHSLNDTSILERCRPAITTHPQGQSACEGDSVTFRVESNGCENGYQWRKDGVEIAGANESTYSMVSVAPYDEGLYDVVVHGISGSVTSDPASLSVAHTIPYGSPTLGTVCPPTITVSCPKLGTTAVLNIGFGLGGSAGVIYIGLTNPSIPFLAGTLWAAPDIPVPITLSGSRPCIGTAQLFIPIPNDANLVNLSLFTQGLFLDPGAPQGVSMTWGVEVVVG